MVLGLPDELAILIFSFLDEFLLPAKFVCREWSSKIQIHRRRKLIRSVCYWGQRSLFDWIYDWLGEDIICQKRIYHSARGGQFEMIEYLLTLGCFLDERVCAEASVNDLKFLQQIRQLKCLWDGEVLLNSAFAGRLESLKWALKEGCPLYPNKKSKYWYQDNFLYHAVLGGHFDIVKWCIEENYNKSEKWRFESSDLTREVFLVSVENFNLEQLIWLKDMGYFCTCEKELESAAQRGDLQILKWLKSEGCKLNKSSLIDFAAKSGNISVIEWLRRKGCKFTRKTCLVAVENGHLNLLKWLISQNAPFKGKEICLAAIQSRQFDILDWALSQGMKPNDQCSDAAVEAGGLKLLKILDRHNCPRGDNVLWNACVVGNLEVVEWAWENKFSREEEYYFSAAMNGFPHVLEWLKRKGQLFDEDVLVDSAIRGGKISTLKWITHQGISPKERSNYPIWNNLVVLRWMWRNGYIDNIEEIYRNTAKQEVRIWSEKIVLQVKN